MSKIKPKQIPHQLVYINSPEGELYILNELELLDLRIMICEEGESGWHGSWNGQKIEIDKNGEVIKWPEGLFCEDFKLLTELMKLSLKKRMLRCSCGGTFEAVESNLPYNDTHFQCNQCDGTKA